MSVSLRRARPDAAGRLRFTLTQAEGAPPPYVDFREPGAPIARLHLSWRADEGRLVLNAQDDQGGWGAERSLPAPGGARSVAVEIEVVDDTAHLRAGDATAAFRPAVWPRFLTEIALGGDVEADPLLDPRDPARLWRFAELPRPLVRAGEPGARIDALAPGLTALLLLDAPPEPAHVESLCAAFDHVLATACDPAHLARLGALRARCFNLRLHALDAPPPGPAPAARRLEWAIAKAGTMNVAVIDRPAPADPAALGALLDRANAFLRGDNFLLALEAGPHGPAMTVFSRRFPLAFLEEGGRPVLHPLVAARMARLAGPGPGPDQPVAAPGLSRLRLEVDGAPRPLSSAPKVLTLITCCEARRHRIAAQKATWIPDLVAAGLPYAVVIGRPRQPSRMVGDVLYVDAPDDYEGLPKKIAAAIAHVVAEDVYDVVLKLDDDALVDVARLFLAPFETGEYWGGRMARGAAAAADWHFGKCANPQIDDMFAPVDPSVDWCAGQFGYALGRRAMRIVAENAAAVGRELYEDYAVAKTLAAHGLRPTCGHYDFYGLAWNDHAAHAVPEPAIVSDFPDEATLRAAHARLSREPGWGAPLRLFAARCAVRLSP